MKNDTIEVRLHIVKGCAVAEETLTNIYLAAEKLGIKDRIVVWIHASYDQRDADYRKFPGSPTITIDWKDISPDDAGDPCFGSRLYWENGLLTSLLSVEKIKAAMKKVLLEEQAAKKDEG